MTPENLVDLTPTFDSLFIQTNAHIKCESSNSGDFENRHTQQFSLPYPGPGPNMEWKGETCCFATTTASITKQASSTTLQAKIGVENQYGGCCGRNDGLAKGGFGELKPVVTGTLQLPRPGFAADWRVDLSLQVSQSEEVGRRTGEFTIKLVGTSGEPGDIFIFPAPIKSADFHIPSIKPGNYNFEWTFPHLLRGCNGARFGTRSQSTLSSELTVSCALRLLLDDTSGLEQPSEPNAY